jgi:hypothetical protein
VGKGILPALPERQNVSQLEAVAAPRTQALELRDLALMVLHLQLLLELSTLLRRMLLRTPVLVVVQVVSTGPMISPQGPAVPVL